MCCLYCLSDRLRAHFVVEVHRPGGQDHQELTVHKSKRHLQVVTLESAQFLPQSGQETVLSTLLQTLAGDSTTAAANMLVVIDWSQNCV